MGRKALVDVDSAVQPEGDDVPASEGEVDRGAGRVRGLHQVAVGVPVEAPADEVRGRSGGSDEGDVRGGERGGRLIRHLGAERGRSPLDLEGVQRKVTEEALRVEDRLLLGRVREVSEDVRLRDAERRGGLSAGARWVGVEVEVVEVVAGVVEGVHVPDPELVGLAEDVLVGRLLVGEVAVLVPHHGRDDYRHVVAHQRVEEDHPDVVRIVGQVHSGVRQLVGRVEVSVDYLDYVGLASPWVEDREPEDGLELGCERRGGRRRLGVHCVILHHADLGREALCRRDAGRVLLALERVEAPLHGEVRCRRPLRHYARVEVRDDGIRDRRVRHLHRDGGVGGGVGVRDGRASGRVGVVLLQGAGERDLLVGKRPGRGRRLGCEGGREDLLDRAVDYLELSLVYALALRRVGEGEDRPDGHLLGIGVEVHLHRFLDLRLLEAYPRDVRLCL